MSAQPLPVIVSYGGISGAGRSSSDHAYGRLIENRAQTGFRQRVLASLRALTGAGSEISEQSLLDGTLIRRIEPASFDPDSVAWNQRLPTQSDGTPVTFDIRLRHLPSKIPPDWRVTPRSDDHVNVQIIGEQTFLLPTHRDFEVKAAGQLPSGFDPSRLYPSRNHPRGLQMSVFAASDALGSLGLDWDSLFEHVSIDQVSVYAGSAMGQLDDSGTGGMLKARYNGQRVTSKYCPLGLAEMPADFINAYVLGAYGSTGASLGACASFLYNLRHAIHDIRSGRSRVAFIGGAEAPITPEVMEGYMAMGALATDKELRQLDGLPEDAEPDHRRACRPFSHNCGFTIAESAQMLVLFDDALALELGASIHGAAADVFVNADGFKKSISGPGVGNYLTMAKATAAARGIIGERRLRSGGLVLAHGTGTPQNRTTESEILSRTAQAFGISDWPVAALKCYLGHSLGAASADQVNMLMGIWRHGVVPGISTITELAEDVRTDSLAFCLEHREFDRNEAAYAIVNSKGFGGNNASATLLSPLATRDLLRARHGAGAMETWARANEQVADRQAAFEQACLENTAETVYRFDHNVLHDDAVSITDREIVIGGHRVALAGTSPYGSLDEEGGSSR